MQDLEKRTLVAVALSILVIVLYPILLSKFYPQKTEQITTPEIKPQATTQADIFQAKEPAPVEKQPLKEKILLLEAGSQKVYLSNTGAVIKKIVLGDFKDKETGKEMVLAQAAMPNEGILNIEWISPQILDELQYVENPITDGVSYTFGSPELIVIKRVIAKNPPYGLDVEIEIKNKTKDKIQLAYKITGGSNITKGVGFDQRFLEAESKIDGRFYRENNNKIKKEGYVYHKGSVDWVVTRNRYFAIVLKPYSPASAAFSKSLPNENFQTGLIVGPVEVPAESSIIHRYLLYSGPSRKDVLASFNAGLEETINYGFFDGIGKFLMSVLRILHNMVHNWGAAIIMLSVGISILFYPLTLRSFTHMKKSQELQPQIAKLREELKDNPQKLNKEMWELYRKSKANPFGGCLPAILQMPIFIALYQALIRAVEFREANFLWIKDLSSPDTLFKLPFSMPFLGDKFNLLPILMAATMFIQQKAFAPKGIQLDDVQRQQQQMMSVLMPVMFGGLFYNFPSSLVLYWLTNTLIMVFQQSLIMRGRA